jgi:phosphatidylglycerophosphate synthase
MSDLDPALAPRHAGQTDPLRDLARVAMLGGFVVLAAGVALVGLDGALWLPALGYGLGVWLVLGLFRRGYPHGRLGLCNAATLARLALTAALLAPLAGAAEPWAVPGVAVLALTLDGVDGWLARREGLVSDVGARFDMEVDSALALILALNALAAGTAGLIVLAIGLPRYVFAAAGLLAPWLDGPLPERFSRKLVCVVQIATLIALQLPPLGAGLANPLVAAVAAGLAWSFGKDVIWLWRARA